VDLFGQSGIAGSTMSQFPQSDAEDDRPPQAARLAPRLHALANEGVYFGVP
jgi:hypothetical protein